MRPTELSLGIAGMASSQAVCVALLRPRGYAPLAPRCGYPITLGRHFFSAGHAKHGATPSGVFNWQRERSVRGLGFPQPAFRNIQKDISETLLAYANSFRLKLLSMCDIMLPMTD